MHRSVLLLWVLAATAAQAETLDTMDQWPSWRGPLQTGEAPNAKPPVFWTEGQNVRWKLPLPGEGHSSPVVWGDQIFITAAVPFGDPVEPIPDIAEGAHDNRLVTHHYAFQVLCASRDEGRMLWTTTVCKKRPEEGGYVTGSLASNSAVTDGRAVYAFFGSRGLYALDLKGNILWQKDLGKMYTRHAHGEGASPALHDDTLIVNWDHEKASFIMAIDTATGRERWKTMRDEKTSWSTPIIAEIDGAFQVIVSATHRIRGYDLRTGAQIWECGGLSRNVVASPIYADGMLYVSNSYDWKIMMGIRLPGARGDLTGTDRVVWTLDRQTSYVPSPLLMDDKLYFLGHLSGIMTQVHAPTGKILQGPFRLPEIGNVFASPVGADGRIYVADRAGAVLVMTHADAPQPLRVNHLQDRFVATPALVGSQLILRGHRFLYCLEEKAPRVE